MSDYLGNVVRHLRKVVHREPVAIATWGSDQCSDGESDWVSLPLTVPADAIACGLVFDAGDVWTCGLELGFNGLTVRWNLEQQNAFLVFVPEKVEVQLRARVGTVRSAKLLGWFLSDG